MDMLKSFKDLGVVCQVVILIVIVVIVYYGYKHYIGENLTNPYAGSRLGFYNLSSASGRGLIVPAGVVNAATGRGVPIRTATIY